MSECDRHVVNVNHTKCDSVNISYPYHSQLPLLEVGRGMYECFIALSLVQQEHRNLSWSDYKICPPVIFL